jgi:hypothetical protein
MKRGLVAILLFVGSAAWFVGCDRRAAPAQSPTRPAPTPKDGGAHARTPGADVDVGRRGDGKGVRVDVRTKDAEK